MIVQLFFYLGIILVFVIWNIHKILAFIFPERYIKAFFLTENNKIIDKLIRVKSPYSFNYDNVDYKFNRSLVYSFKKLTAYIYTLNVPDPINLKTMTYKSDPLIDKKLSNIEFSKLFVEDKKLIDNNLMLVIFVGIGVFLLIMMFRDKLPF